MNNQREKGSALALLPLGVFLVLFIGSGIISGDFYKMPTLVAFIISTAVAFLFNRKVDFNTKMEVFCKGGGNKDIILMIIIFLFAGAFSGVAKAIGGDTAVVNLGLSILPANLLVTGLFVIGCFISISMGTSVGTIAAIGPIGVAIASQTSIPVALVLGAVVGGAMFGDNLSMISDTTIAATKTQGCEMKDKFRVNFAIVLPAAIVTIILLTIMTSGYTVSTNETYTYEFVKVLPYLFVVIGAILGGNVFLLLGGGVIFASVVGISTNSLHWLISPTAKTVSCAFFTFAFSMKSSSFALSDKPAIMSTPTIFCKSCGWVCTKQPVATTIACGFCFTARRINCLDLPSAKAVTVQVLII